MYGLYNRFPRSEPVNPGSVSTCILVAVFYFRFLAIAYMEDISENARVLNIFDPDPDRISVEIGLVNRNHPQASGQASFGQDTVNKALEHAPDKGTVTGV